MLKPGPRTVSGRYHTLRHLCPGERTAPADRCVHPQAKRSKACIPLVQDARRAILLTGTPALSRPGEIMTQLQVRECRYPTVCVTAPSHGTSSVMRMGFKSDKSPDEFKPGSGHGQVGGHAPVRVALVLTGPRKDTELA